MSSRKYSSVIMTDSKVFTLRMPNELRAAIDKRAKERLRSINNEIVILLKLGLANETDETVALKKANELMTQKATRVQDGS